MKNIDTVFLEVGKDIKEKLEKGEQIHYKDYLTEENIKILDYFENITREKETDYRLHGEIYNAAIESIKCIQDFKALECAYRFLSDARYFNKKYNFLLNHFFGSYESLYDSTFSKIKFLEKQIEKTLISKDIDSFVDYALKEGCYTLWLKNGYFGYYTGENADRFLPELQEIDPENKIETIKNRIFVSYNEETFQL